MLKILTIAQTRQAEAEADANGYSYTQMMDAAGHAVAQRALALIAARDHAKITVLVGAGNNGGDGLVAGRVIAQARPDAQVRFYLLTQRDPNTDPVFKAALDAGLFMAYAEHDFDGRALRHMVASADLVLDALFGIGARLPLRDTPARVLRTARQALAERAKARRTPVLNDPTSGGQIERAPHTYVLAVDCPSGLQCDSGEIDSTALTADETVTFIAVKPGLLTFPGAAHVGRLWVASLEMPDDLTVPTLESARAFLLDNDSVRDLLPARPPDSHKGTFGRALIVGGSGEYVGAVGLAARAAYASGVGLVTASAPANVIHALVGQVLEATWQTLPDLDGALVPEAVGRLAPLITQCRALLVGPGMGRAEVTGAFLHTLLSQPLPPLVLDADALNLLTELEAWESRLPAETILTPHPGEMARLCGLPSAADLPRDRQTFAAQKADAWRAVVVLKGAHTVIASPDGRLAVSPFKNAALAKGGTGDVLAGLATGLRAQGMSAFDAACVAVYVQGLAGEIAAQRAEHSARSLTAGDVVMHLSAALARVEQG